MGLMGWAPCFWCGQWEWNPYIADPLTDPLCEFCMDWFIEGGGPFFPSAQQKCAMRLQIAFRPLPWNVCFNIAEMTHDWYEA